MLGDVILGECDDALASLLIEGLAVELDADIGRINIALLNRHEDAGEHLRAERDDILVETPASTELDLIDRVDCPALREDVRLAHRGDQAVDECHRVGDAIEIDNRRDVDVALLLRHMLGSSFYSLSVPIETIPVKCMHPPYR